MELLRICDSIKDSDTLIAKGNAKIASKRSLTYFGLSLTLSANLLNSEKRKFDTFFSVLRESNSSSVVPKHSDN